MKTFEERSPRYQRWSEWPRIALGLLWPAIVGLAFLGLLVSGLVAVARRAF